MVSAGSAKGVVDGIPVKDEEIVQIDVCEVRKPNIKIFEHRDIEEMEPRDTIEVAYR